MSDQPEAFSRILIDDCLRDSGWDILDVNQIRLELNMKSGRADYTLLGTRGALCVLEAKKPSVDPYEAREQARGYAENVGAPFIILSNGTEHWFWNYKAGEEAYRIQRFPTRSDLEHKRLKNLSPARPLSTEIIKSDYLASNRPDLKLRGYQIRALEAIAKAFDQRNQRKFLLEMATGTGKTLLCAAAIRQFLQSRNAERVLFIVDRIELAKQTLEDFAVVLREYKPVIYKTARKKPGELLGSSIIVATIQSLMTDRRYRKEFTPFHFDLVINDEAHRSIYGDSREVVEFFQGTRIGLTATPKAYLKNIDVASLRRDEPKHLEARELLDTYHYFGCSPGQPTFRYDIIEAVKDPEGPFLCMPKIFDVKSAITTQALAEGGWALVIDESEETYKIQDLERKIFTPRRNVLMCESFLKQAQRDPYGQIGKTIIFAVNQNHANNITKILNGIEPDLAMTITSRIPDSSTLAKEFRDGKRTERVAVSVDMLSTGYNCRDLLNVVLMRPIFSPTEYIQIKGRGTRRFKFTDEKTQTEYEKQVFYLLDFCGVCEYFEEEYDYSVPLELPQKRTSSEGSITEAESTSSTGNYRDSVWRDQAATPQVSEQTEQVIRDGLPIWEGTDTVVSEAVRLIGPDGEKVDIMTFRGSFERDIATFTDENTDFSEAIAAEDDDAISSILQERFFHQPNMYYSPDKLVISYGLPTTVPTFVYGALGKRPLPSKEDILNDTVDSLSSRFNLHFSQERWLATTVQLIAEDPEALKRFVNSDMTIFSASQFNQLGGLTELTRLEHRDLLFEALRQSTLVKQASLGI